MRVKMITNIANLIFIMSIFTISLSAATYTVNLPDDSGDGVCDTTCTLRDAVLAANSTNPLDDTITFLPFLTRITLNNEIAVDTLGRILIDGPGADRLTIDGGIGSNRIFYVFSSGGSSSIFDISDVTLTGGNGAGSVANGQGGAIYVRAPAFMRLLRVHVTGNTAASGGGIGYNSTGLTVFDSTFSDNTATGDCGGFFNNGDGLIIVNSTISGNNAANDGGGFCHINSGGLQNVTVTDNTAFRGGGIALRSFSGIFTVWNSIIAGNDHTGGGNPEIYRNDPPAMFISDGYNLIGDNAGDSADTNVPITFQPTDILDISPQLIALNNNGGTTPTNALQFNSPAKDAADPTSGLEFDQRGFEREVTEIDIGAFEIQDNRHWYVTQTADDNGVCDENCSLREAIEAAPQEAIVEFGRNLTASTPIIVTSEILLDKNVTIVGHGANKTIISADFTNHRIFFMNALTVTISGLTLTGGSEGQGGAIYCLGRSLIIDGVHFQNNAAVSGGGVFFSSFSRNSEIRDSTFSENDANGGGFYCDGTGSSPFPQVTVVNSTFTSNFSVQNGPAFTSNRCNLDARNITVSGNTGINNGGIFVTSNGTLNIGNSIVSGNTTITTDPALLRPEISIFGDGSVTAAGNNLVGDSPGEAANTGSPIVYDPATDILDTPPLLGILQDNGGPMPTIELLSGSPAINAGNNAAANDPLNGLPLMTDQRGFLRFFGSPFATVDIGSFEFGSAASWSSNTPSGSNVNVSVGPSTVNFAGVSVPGDTTVSPIDPAMAGQIPGGFTLGDGYPAYEISTTATYTAPVIVCIQAPAVVNPVVFNALNILHYESGNLVNRTSSRNFASKTVCASVSSLSPFVVARSLAPTAARVSVSGRVISSAGRGIGKAGVSITNPLSGETRTVISSHFGYYQITDIESGKGYILSARHKMHRFSPRAIIVSEELTDADLIAEPSKTKRTQKKVNGNYMKLRN